MIGLRSCMRAGTGLLRPLTASLAWLAFVLLATGGSVQAQTVQLSPAADGTLYAESGALANGSGVSLFGGRILDGTRRRALLRFDVASALPAGATVTAATLELSVTRTIADAVPFSLHRVSAPWGEGASDAGEPGGQGTLAEPGDVTWNLRFHPDQAWTTPGGDFTATASSVGVVGGEGRHAWTGLAGDVQDWLQDPASNHGWLLMADESLPGPTAKRFASREHADPALRPLLTIEYTVLPPPRAEPATIPAAGAGALVLLAGLLGLLAAVVLRGRQ